jgi:hypothetical protein
MLLPAKQLVGGGEVGTILVGDRDGFDDRDGSDVGDRDGRAMGVIEGTLDNVGELVIVGDDDGENAGFGVTVQVALSLSKSTLE